MTLKRSVKKLSLVLGLLVTTTSCSSSDVKAGSDRPVPKDYVPALSEVLTTTGYNSRAQFSADGKKIFFVSKNRDKHTHPQVYELDVATKKDRRLTYQDGEIFDVAVDPKSQKIFYSSSTDEIKENSVFIRDTIAKLRATQAEAAQKQEWRSFSNEALPATEIYSSARDGRGITRLTEETGFDGMIAVHPKKNEFAFISARDQQKRLYIAKNETFKNLTAVTPKSISVEDESPSFSPDGAKLIWTRLKSDKTGSDLLLSPNPPSAKNSTPHTLVADSKMILSPSWHPNGEDIAFASNRDEEKNFELYAVKADGSCLRRLTFTSGVENNPRFSPDGQKILFDRTQDGKSHLFLMLFTPPPCPAASKPVES